MENDDTDAWMAPAFREVHRVLKDNRLCVCLYGWQAADRFLAAWRAARLRPVGHIVWTKPYASHTRYLGARHECAYLLAKGTPPLPEKPIPDVLQWSSTGNLLHPTQKPVSGLLLLVKAFSSPGDLVLDPFAGSGTTGLAARLCDRRFLLIEKDAAYARIARRRLAA